MITIYAAGPIDLGADIPNWRTHLITALQNLELTAVLFDPSSAYKQASWGKKDLTRTRYIEEVNKAALEQAAAFVVCLPKGVSSVGTPIELDWAYQLAKPIIFITDILPGSSVYLDNRVTGENWILTDLKDPNSVQAAITSTAQRLQELMFGPKKDPNQRNTNV